jgi:4-hydroxy-tetrahydrodipicolinate reductase
MVAKLLEGTSSFPPLVIGTTGLSHDTMESIKQYAQRAACLVASNFSLGIAILRACIRLAAAKLPDTFEAEIVEIHHRHKRDIPSGTAQSLSDDIRDAQMPSHDTGRETTYEPVKIHSLRMASVVGEHQVILAGPGEQLRFIHQAENRNIFARGALYAAQWICGQNPGLYHIEDVFGI